ncbi:MAG TPA: GNAT family N-acetyltransferase [Myxococcaceae bacterium]|nr:GNAT family N-acetyltransferase [Myxococcaceae bacterium]
MSRDPPPLRLERLKAVDRALLGGLYDAYLEELVSFGASYRRRDDGRWEYRPAGGDWGLDHLPYWLAEAPEHRVLLFRVGRRVVGFAMIGLRPACWMSPGTDACISEFYVRPEARRRGIGEAAARRIFQRWRGRWEVPEVAGNAPAIAFWRRIIARFTGGAFEEVEAHGGPAQRFTSRQPRRRAKPPPRQHPGPHGGARRPPATRRSRGAARAPPR